MGFQDLRRNIPIEEFDYQLMMSYLNEYANKRDKITRLIKEGKVIRVKKGLYVFGPDFRKGFVCREALANLIYGPSYVSYEYALSYHGLIPERVELITSATTGQTRRFDTPIGSFTYRHLPPKKYVPGLIYHQFDEYHQVLIATPEKALADKVATTKGLSRSYDVNEFLVEDLRIDESALKSLSTDRLEEISNAYQNSHVLRLTKFIKKVQANA